MLGQDRIDDKQTSNLNCGSCQDPLLQAEAESPEELPEGGALGRAVI